MEHQAFLAGEEDRTDQHHEHNSTSRPQSRQESQFSRYYFCSIFTLKFCIQFTTALLELPLLRAIEQKICQTNTSEASCKDSLVQDRLARIIGYKSTFDALPCLLTALVYSSISNHYGRKPVMMISIAGQALALAWITAICFVDTDGSPELVWLSSLFLFLGGGFRFELSMQYTSFCDLVPWKRRTRLLSYLHASDGIAGLLGYPIGSKLMENHLLYPFGLAFAVYMLRALVLYRIPETSPYLNSIGAGSSSQFDPQQGWESDQSTRESISHTSPHQSSKGTTGHWNTLLSRTQIMKLLSFWKHQGLRVLFICFLAKRIGFASESFTFQYASEILGKNLSETFWLRAFAHLGMLLTLSILLPLLTRCLKSPAKEIWVLRTSLIDLIIGFATLWRGHTLAALCLGLLICGLGEGLEVSLQSLGSFIVGEANHATFFAFASMLGVSGELIGGPMMAWTYSIRGSQSLPLGYCFALSVAIFSSLFAGSFFLKTNQL